VMMGLVTSLVTVRNCRLRESSEVEGGARLHVNALDETFARQLGGYVPGCSLADRSDCGRCWRFLLLIRRQSWLNQYKATV
jgi:hypothetical protein